MIFLIIIVFILFVLGVIAIEKGRSWRKKIAYSKSDAEVGFHITFMHRNKLSVFCYNNDRFIIIVTVCLGLLLLFLSFC